MSSTQQVFNGRYEITRPIARGGMAEVFLARDQLLDRPVALKVLFPELSTDKNFVARFRREAQNAANLTHPNVVSVYDWGEEGSTYFIVMEYVDGTSVAQELRENGPFAPERAAKIGADVASAIGFAHRNGVIHRDVKPANILINQSEQVKVTDFGIARARNVDDNLTQTGTVMGTATYFSPEQAQGLPIDGRSDIYALGVVLYEMVVGAPPFVGDNAVTIATKHVNEQPITVRQKNPNVPEALEAIIMTAMAKNAADRYATAEEMSADLQRFVAGNPVMATPPNLTQAIPSALARDRYAQNMGTGVMNQSTQMQPAVTTKHRRTDTYLVLLFVMLLALAGVFYALWRTLDSGKTSIVPSVVGKTLEDARRTIEDHGLSVGTITEQDPPAGSVTDPGVVLQQTPGFNTHLKRGGSVNLIVSKAVDQVGVPGVVDQTQAAAEKTLGDLGFQVSIVQQNSDKPVGTVIDQTPAKGEKAAKGSTVTLTVSSGKESVAIPDVTDKKEADADAALTAAGFRTDVQHQFSDSVEAGRVISTDPAAGNQIATGSRVIIIVSDGPKTTSTTAGSTTTTSSSGH